jgi:hypothetical protein
LIKSTCSVKTTPSLFCTRLVDSFQCDWLFVYEECASDSAPFSFVYLFIVFFFFVGFGVFTFYVFQSSLLWWCLAWNRLFRTSFETQRIFLFENDKLTGKFSKFLYKSLNRRQIRFSFWYYLFINSVSNNNLIKTRKHTTNNFQSKKKPKKIKIKK